MFPQPNQAGKYVYGGGYDPDGQFSKGIDYDANRMSNAVNQDPAIGQLVNNQHGSSSASHSYQIGTTDSGSTGVVISFSHAGDSSGTADNQDQAANWNHYDISAVNNYVANDDQYVIVQEDPEAQNGDHTWDMLNPAGYANADDPTGEKTLSKYMLQLGSDWSSMGSTYPQVYYVYLKRKQKINYQVLVEDKNGHVVKTLTPETLLGVGGSNEQVATTKVNGALSTDPTTIGDRYQSILKQLDDRGFQAVTSADGQLRVSDSLDQLTFDNDATKDQLLTIYVTQPKTVQVHYVDVDGSAKTGHYTVNDGIDMLDHMQNISGLAGSDYHNQLWNWKADGYVLATSEDQIDPGTTQGSFQLNDPSSRAFYIYLKHGKQAVNDQDVVKHETIHYVYEDGGQASPDYHAPAITFNRTGTKDLVTNKITWDPWTTDNDTFVAVDSPIIDGYLPDIKRVNAIKMTVQTGDIERAVTYHPAAQKLTVTFIDDSENGKVLKTVIKNGVSGADAGYNTKDDIQKFKDQFYTLVSDETHGQTLRFDNDQSVDQYYEVHLKHTSQSHSENKTVNETIHYVYEDGRQAWLDYHAPAITFSRTGVKDLVTNKITWDPWTTDNDTFAAVDSPTIDGYLPDIERVNAIKMTVENGNVEKTVTYTKKTDHDTPDQHPDQPGQPIDPGDQSYPNNLSSTSSLSSVNNDQQNIAFSHQTGQHSNRQLPQTGNAGNQWSVVGLAMSSLLGLIAWDRRRKRN